MQKTLTRRHYRLNSKLVKWGSVIAVYALLYCATGFLPEYAEAAKDLPIPIWINLIILMPISWAMLNSLLSSGDRGLVYSLSRVVLPFETALFLVCIQFCLWPTILIPAAIGFVALMLYLRSDVLYHRFRCHLYSRNVMRAISACAGKQNPTPRHVRQVVIKRVTVITAAVLLAVPMVRILCFPEPDGAIERAEAHMAVGVSGNRILDNIEFVNCFRDENWYKLSSQKKLDAMQVIADIETASGNEEGQRTY